ncbi:MAG: helix-hairpin-helix domain-containing protein [Candidatus Methanomethylicia archaeon]|nr:helix-hairpin-helix domain-containing protein [Candidatus Methanomethylicia archaeon]MCX8169025.1 helix-hairpin-helix domain-containing protein [Candidatus Methanomethylicia archaeon]MDW7988757.1 ERCC4 domain-containing protein [Nitrososphaerota archaeon]
MVSLRVFVDERERNCKVPILLKEMGLYVLFRQLPVGDYVISNDCAVERKNARDFVNSVVEGRIFDQASRLSQYYPKSAIIVEGDLEHIYETLKAGIKAFYGVLSSIWLNLGIAFFFTKDVYDTAQLLYSLVKHEQEEFKKIITVKGKTKLSTLSEKQLFVVSSFPGIGQKTALRLLNKFGSIKNIVLASPVELAMVEGISRGKAEKLVNFLNTKFEGVESSYKQSKLRLN